MNKPIHFLIILCCLSVSLADAQYQSVYENHLDTEKIIIKFNPQLNNQEKNEKLKEIPSVVDWGHLSHPSITIAQIDASSSQEYYQTITELEQKSDIEYVGLYFKNENDALFGVLDQVMVQIRKPADYKLLKQAVEKYNLKSIVPHRMQNVYELHLDKDATISTVDLAITLHQSGKFVYAEPNYLYNPIVTNVNDSLYNYQWALNNTGSSMQYNGTVDADMDVDDAWTITTGEPYIKIAIMDSGVDTLHPDLVANLLPGYSANGDSTNGYPSFNYSSDGHGTCCAGIVAAQADNNIGVAGVAPNCKLVPVKIFYYDNIPLIGVTAYSTASTMADGITWAWQDGNADVLSNSWGLENITIPLLPGPGDTSTVNLAINQAYANGRGGKGSVLLFSSGNEGNAPIWPGREAAAISVNATSMCDQRKMPSSCDGENWEGNWGANLELGAPGVKIATTDAIGSNGYSFGDYEMTYNGTSAACPNAAGVMALILSVDSSLTVEQARAIIDSTAEKVGGYSYSTSKVYGMWSSELGYGRVNAYQAVLAAQGVSVSSPKIHAQVHFELYPNPAQDRVIVGHKLENDQAVRLTVYTNLGQKVLEQNVVNLDLTELNTQLLSNGIYYISLETEKTVVSKKIHILR